MARREWLGPVFAHEWRAGSRLWRTYAARSMFVAALLAAIAAAWLATGRDARSPAGAGSAVYRAIAGSLLALAMIAAPAATAGAICRDRSSGLLDHLLVTDLSSGEIVLGKLAARGAPAIGLVACSLPVMLVGSLLWGIDPAALAGAALLAAALAMLGCSLAMALSVWGSRPHEVLVGTYLLWTAWLSSEPIGWAVVFLQGGTSPPLWLLKANPIWLAFAPYDNPGDAGLDDFVGFAVAAVALSAALATLATARLRGVAGRRGDRPSAGGATAPGRRLRWLPGPPIDPNPVLWREWRRLRGSRWAERVWLIYGIGALLFTGVALSQEFQYGAWAGSGLAATINEGQVAVGLLILTVASASAWAEERGPGALDALLSTPLDARSIVWGKWWGAVRAAPVVALLPAILAIGPSWRAGRVLPPAIIFLVVLGHAVALSSLGLALATWIGRSGRAIAWGVAAFALVDIGWYEVGMSLGRRRASWWPLLWGSAVFAVTELTNGMEWAYGRHERLWGVWFRQTLAWLAVDLAASALLITAVVLTFDRAFGRIAGRSRPGHSASGG